MEKLVTYDDGRKVSIDGRYYIIKKERPAPTEEAVILTSGAIWIRPDKETRKTTYPKNGKNYVAEDVLYNASGKEIITGEEIFEDKREVAGIRLDFIGQNIFFAWAVGWRENTTFYVYRILDDKPEFLYKVLGGDCSFLVGGNRPKISKDGLLSVAYEDTGSYETTGDRYIVLRYKNRILKEYHFGFENKIYPLSNGRWLEIRAKEIVLCWARDGETVKELESIKYRSSAEILFQDNFLIMLKETDRAILDIYDRETLGEMGMLGVDLDGDTFYLDFSSDKPIIRIARVKREDVSSIESSPRGQYVILETRQGTFVYEYTNKKLLNKQKINPKHSFCFKQQ